MDDKDEKSRRFWQMYSGGVDYASLEERVLADNFRADRNPRARKLWEQMNEEMMAAMQEQLYNAAAAPADEGLTDEDFDADLDTDSERSRRRARVDQFTVFVDEHGFKSTPPGGDTKYPGEAGDLIWEAKDGRQTPVKEMATAHLINAIRLIQSNRGWRQEFLKPMMRELNSRGAGHAYDRGGNIKSVRHSDKDPRQLAFNGKRPGLFKGR